MTACARCLVGWSAATWLAIGPVAGQSQPVASRTGPAPGRHDGASPARDEYRIGPEDVLEILIWRNLDLTRTVQVRPDGKISLPLLNDVQAADLTPMQLRDSLSDGYAKYFTEPEVAVNVREVHSFKVSVLGMVKTPGRYELKSQATVLEALALAGGFTEFAKRDKTFVSRSGRTEGTRLPFHYSKVLDGDDRENFVLHPGDIIVVP